MAGKNTRLSLNLFVALAMIALLLYFRGDDVAIAQYEYLLLLRVFAPRPRCTWLMSKASTFSSRSAGLEGFCLLHCPILGLL